MGSFNKNSFDKRVNDLRDKHLLRFESEKLSRVELNVPGKTLIELGRTGSNEWQIVRPRPMRADGFQVDELVRNLRDAQMDANADAKQAASAFGSGRLVATAKVVSPDGEGTFEVRESKGEYYARSNMVEGAFKISMDTGTGLNKSLDDLRSKKIFDFSFDDPNKIEFNDNGKLQIFEKSGENWTSGGKTMDSISVQNLVDKLRDFGIAGYEAPAVAQAEITITVVSKNGSRTETVEMQAKGTDWSARRMGSNETYRVTGTDITSLRQAVSGVREPPPPDKAGKDAKGDNK
jgi:hypothetical protein